MFAGFTRGHAYLAWGKNKCVEVLVYDGTFEDAQLYALAENRKHGQRSKAGDKAKSVRAVLDNPALLLARVRDSYPNRAFVMESRVCHVSESFVREVLKARGGAHREGARYSTSSRNSLRSLIVGAVLHLLNWKKNR